MIECDGLEQIQNYAIQTEAGASAMADSIAE
jgi:hypothetical protein